jgi:mono/diheme cytochrome c family protein
MSPIRENSSTKGNRRQGGFGTLNLVLLAGSLALFVWGGLYVGKYGGRFDPDEFDEVPHPRAPKVVATSADPNAAVLKQGQKAYSLSCMACHQADGNGDEGKFIPPLAGSDWLLADGPARIIRITLHGLSGPIKVKDKDWGQGQMISQIKTADNPAGLPPEDLAAAISYARNSWGNKASIITADQVKAVIEETKDRSTPWTAEELLKIPVAVGAGGASTNALPSLEQLKAALKALPADQLDSVLKEVKK